MTEFTQSLAPMINELAAQAITQHIERMHADFALLAELTKDAKGYEEIAQRFIDRGLVHTRQPSDSVNDYQNVCEEFVSKVAELLWIPGIDEEVE
ncbi:MAG: hypothetical protein ACXWAT_11035 [Methylobacter sp.]